MKEIIDFLVQLSLHNDREWFMNHKEEYVRLNARFNTFVEGLIAGISHFDERVRGLAVKDCTFRIYRDMRFSQGKPPYNARFSAYVCPRGKMSGYAGYYVHIEPGENLLFLCSGLYNPTPAVLQAIREDIEYNPTEFREALAQCVDFDLPWDRALKKVPREFDPADEQAAYYRLRSYELVKNVTLHEVLDAHFLEQCVAHFARTYSYNCLMNRCVDFVAGEE